MKNNAAARQETLLVGLVGKALKLMTICSSAALDQAFTEKHSGSFCGCLYRRDLWFDGWNGGMPRGALRESLGHEQQPGHTLSEQGPGMMLLGVIPYSLLSNLASAVLILQ